MVPHLLMSLPATFRDKLPLPLPHTTRQQPHTSNIINHLHNPSCKFDASTASPWSTKASLPAPTAEHANSRLASRNPRKRGEFARGPAARPCQPLADPTDTLGSWTILILYRWRGLSARVSKATCQTNAVRLKQSLWNLPCMESPIRQVSEVNPSSLARLANLVSSLVICSLMIRGLPLIGFLQATQFI
jgi:hypothetical protein